MAKRKLNRKTESISKAGTTRHAKPAAVSNPTPKEVRQLWAQMKGKLQAIKPPPDSRKASARDVRAQLREYHRLGMLVNHKLGGRGTYGDETVIRLARHAKLNRSWISKVRRFPRVYNDRQELRELLALAPKIKWGHIQWLVSIDDPEERRAWAKRTAKKGWTRAELGRQIVGKRRRTTRGGRTPGKPASFKAALLRVDADCKRWQSSCRIAMTAVPVEKNKKLDGVAKKMIAAAKCALESVEKQAQDAIEVLKEFA